jgi:hypothetical protein
MLAGDDRDSADAGFTDSRIQAYKYSIIGAGKARKRENPA